MSNARCSRTIDDFMYSVQIHSLIFLASTTDAMYIATTSSSLLPLLKNSAF
jgi:hypothetical protein